MLFTDVLRSIYSNCKWLFDVWAVIVSSIDCSEFLFKVWVVVGWLLYSITNYILKLCVAYSDSVPLFSRTSDYCSKDSVSDCGRKAWHGMLGKSYENSCFPHIVSTSEIFYRHFILGWKGTMHEILNYIFHSFKFPIIVILIYDLVPLFPEVINAFLSDYINIIFLFSLHF